MRVSVTLYRMTQQTLGRLSTTVAAEFRAEMARQRISALKLSTRLGQSDFYVGRRLRGQVSMSLDDVEAFAQALGVPVDRLLPLSGVTRHLPGRRQAAA